MKKSSAVLHLSVGVLTLRSPIGVSMAPARTLVRRKRTDADELLERSITLGSREISRSRKELTTDDLKMLGIPKWRCSLTLRRKNRLELFFECREHGQAFDDHVVQGGPGDRV